MAKKHARPETFAQLEYAGYMDRPRWGFMDSLTDKQIAWYLSTYDYTHEVSEMYDTYHLKGVITPTKIVRPRYNS